ncbi:NAC transcription factor [Canna indica]|uniref:NAC transcription factor n=1 Tax=Canna indica TaxID=4628 RepID=A0AAQ3QIU2_9LILI|nr:NAC transcription factor [Canna indica]
MEDADDTVPVGYVFSPSDELIVTYFLARKVAGRLPRCCPIREADVYSTEPWNLLGRDCSEAYFFSTRKRKSAAGSRVDRKAGSGSWTLYSKEELVISVVCGAEMVVGRKSCLSFNDGRRKNSGWTMHEYELYCGSDEFQEQVVCHVKVSSRDPLKRKRGGFAETTQPPASPLLRVEIASKRARVDQEPSFPLNGGSAKDALTKNTAVASPEDITWATATDELFSWMVLPEKKGFWSLEELKSFLMLDM